MNRVKAFLLEQEIELDKVEREQVEVLGDSVNECLLLAAKHLGKDIHELDYEVLQRGKKSLLFSEPFRIRVFPAELDEDLDILKGVDEALGTGGRLIDSTLKEHLEAKDKDGFFVIKNYRSGVYLSAHPPVGHGKHVNVEDVMKKFVIKGVTAPDKKKVQEIVSEERGELIRLGNSRLKAFMEAQIKVDIGTDWMKAHCTLIPPKPGGRDVEASDVIYELKKEKVEYGIKEDVIKKYIDEDRYNEPFIAAEGDPPAHGKNAHVVYHVRTEKQIKLKEDNFGRVDYRDLDLIENVVVGQLLAEKVPAEKGKYGRNLINEIIEARDGVDIQLNQGKGTILSEDKKRLTAEVNGQVLFVEGRISVETVYKISGDVGIKTGNVTFLGSVIVTGNVEDNYQIKASGNVEVYGTVQKAIIEADGDIVIRQGITGRDEARVETTGGNVVARFIQNANVITEKDVIVQEGLMHSNVQAGGRIICKGRRAQIVGGHLIANQYVAAKVLGSSANPTTNIIVGVNPKVLKQIEDYQVKKRETREKMDELQKRLNTLKARKEADPLQFSEENQAYNARLEAGIKKLERRMVDYDKEIATLQAYMEKTGGQGRVYIEKAKFRGVSIRIKHVEDNELSLQDLSACTLYLDGERIRSTKYIDPEGDHKEDIEKKQRQKTKVSISG